MGKWGNLYVCPQLSIKYYFFFFFNNIMGYNDLFFPISPSLKPI